MDDKEKIPGAASICQTNSALLAKHDERFTTVLSRLDKFEETQGKIGEDVMAVKTKLFNGYDTKISNINEKVEKIITVLEKVTVNSANVDMLIDKKISDYDSTRLREEKGNSKWLSEHRLEIIVVVIGGFSLVSSILGLIF